MKKKTQRIVSVIIAVALVLALLVPCIAYMI